MILLDASVIYRTHFGGRRAVENPDFEQLVPRIQAGEQAAMEQLYKLLGSGIRYYLCRQLGPVELEDRVHDTFLIVVNAIQRGDLREHARLMGFIRTVVRRQVAGYIEMAIIARREMTDLDAGVEVVDHRWSPEEQMKLQEKAALIKAVLDELRPCDREILTRFYLDEIPWRQICEEMNLSPQQFRLLKNRAKNKFGEIGKDLIRRNELKLIEFRASAEEKIAA